MVKGHEHIKTATSLLDFIFRVLGYEYLGRTDLVHIQDLPDKKPLLLKTEKKVVPKKVKKVTKKLSKVDEARAKGYTGNQCSSCGSVRVKQNGTCTLCLDCGSTSGCS